MVGRLALKPPQIKNGPSSLEDGPLHSAAVLVLILGAVAVVLILVAVLVIVLVAVLILILVLIIHLFFLRKHRFTDLPLS